MDTERRAEIAWEARYRAASEIGAARTKWTDGMTEILYPDPDEREVFEQETGALIRRLSSPRPETAMATQVTDLDAIVARINALPVSVGAGMILVSRDEILQAITGTTQPTAYVRTATPTICCEWCGSAPVAEELSGHPMLHFAVGTQAEADAACAAYLTEYRGWTITITGTNARCDDCARIEFTTEATV